MRVVKVALGERSYPILIGKRTLSLLGAQCARLGLGGSCAIITDRNVAKHYAPVVVQSLRKAGMKVHQITVPPGETAKSLRVVSQCYDELAAQRLERKSFIVALGGGVVGDLAGFVAATYLRGLAFVQVATTLLAQVDSSVGGKVGVNLAAGKNLVGAFHQPRLVLADLGALDTLPEREYRAGLAEVIKYGIIEDATLFGTLEEKLPGLLRRDPAVLAPVIARCCEIKAKVVAEDETESGRRAILNFGHTLGHAIEAISGYGKFLHGEAIAIGQVAAAKLSAELLNLPKKDVQRIRTLMERAGLPVTLRLTSRQVARLRKAMTLDKKVTDGQPRFVLAKSIGMVRIGCSVPAQKITSALLAGNRE